MTWYNEVKIIGNEEEQKEIRELLSKLSENPLSDIPPSELEVMLVTKTFVPRKREIYLCPINSERSSFRFSIPKVATPCNITNYGISFEINGIIYNLCRRHVNGDN